MCIVALSAPSHMVKMPISLAQKLSHLFNYEINLAIAFLGCYKTPSDMI